jgi:hypothetical protein
MQVRTLVMLALAVITSAALSVFLEAASLAKHIQDIIQTSAQ